MEVRKENWLHSLNLWDRTNIQMPAPEIPKRGGWHPQMEKLETEYAGADGAIVTHEVKPLKKRIPMGFRNSYEKQSRSIGSALRAKNSEHTNHRKD